jgi:hypothetical protein
VNVGDRVRVRIEVPKLYAFGCAAALEGKEGTIERTRPAAISGEPVYLVSFDTPAPKWWSNQTPVKAFWFGAEDLAVSS